MEKMILDKVRNISIIVKERLNKTIKEPENIKNYSQIRILRFLHDNKDKKIIQKDICSALNMKKSSITEHLDYLEEIKMIKRINDENDKRKKYIVIGEKVSEHKKKIDIELSKINEDLTKGISKEELEIFNKVLDKMEGNIK